MSQDQSLACDLTAIPANVREEHVVTAPQLFETAQEVQELPNGFAIRFLNEPGKFMEIAKFIENDSLCCPFFNFSVEVEPHRGSLWLRLTGDEGVKELLQVTLFAGGDEKNSLKQQIYTGGDSHLDEVVSQMPLPVLDGVLRNTPAA
jgi:hypothetical protein